MKSNRIESIWVMTIGLLIILAGIAFIVFLAYPSSDSGEETSSIRVIDGDTLQLANGDVVRLICIDPPEKCQTGYTQAKDYLNYIVSNSLNISFVSDSQDKDEYGMLLR
jgi:endonuclease YncB( thermonuclease family)